MESKKARLLRRLKRAESRKMNVAFGENSNPFMQSGLSIHEDFMDKYPSSDMSNDCPSLMRGNNQINSKGEEIFLASQFSSLYSQRKETGVLNDITNCVRNLATDFDQAQSTGNSFIDFPQKRKRCSNFQQQCDPPDVLIRGIHVLDSDIHITNQDQQHQFDTHFINDIEGQHPVHGYHIDGSDDQFENIENDDTNNINYSDLSNLHMGDIVYSDLGNPEWSCTHCGAIFWAYERLHTDIQFTDEQIKCLGLFEIEKHLGKSGKSSKDYPTMPQPDFDLCSSLNNTLIAEQLDFDKGQLADEFKRLSSTMTIEQKNCFDIIISAIDENKGGFFFVNGYGGTGKTFLWRALTAHLRSRGQIVLCVASSGIAATLLPFGRTAHSRFCIPIPICEDSTCNIKQGSFLAELIVKTSLIIWDEAPMVKKHCFVALDRTLRDLMQKINPLSLQLPFGGKCLVLGGDFRQILPVIPGGTRSDVVFASINSSYLWSYCHILTLTQNMRLQPDNPTTDVTELRDFSEWMLKVGDGNLSEPNDSEAEIEVPESLLINDCTDPLHSIFDITYPAFARDYSQPDYLKNRAILTPTLDVVDEVNEFIMSKVPDQEKIYFSSDSVSQDGQNADISSQYITPGLLNDLKLSGLPNHKLTLKAGVPIMLLQNLNQSVGLCNGTRLIVTHLGDHVIAATVISGSNLGHQVYLPRMNLTPSDSRMPFKLQRRQFPIAISYCMTINKSQGQSLSIVTVYLPKPVFAHGQLCVAISRVKSKNGLKFLILDKDKHPVRSTKNVVYKEIFQNIL